MAIGRYLHEFVQPRGLGIVLGEAGALEILHGQVRIPDVSFTRWELLPGRELLRVQIPAVVPDLAVEILSPGNPEGEMQRKLRVYFAPGVQLVWYVDPPPAPSGPTWRPISPCCTGRPTVFLEAESCPASNCLLPISSPKSVQHARTDGAT